MLRRYTLNEHDQPTEEKNLLTWARQFESADRIVAQEQIGESFVSTVFLGLDHGFSESGPPVLWESMVFGGALDGEEDRCGGDRHDAMRMHRQMVARVREHTNNSK